MITIKAHGWHQFLAAFGVLRNAGVEPVASGGNQMRVPDDACRQVLRAVAVTGADVHADLTEPVAANPGAEVEMGAAEEPDSGPEPTPDDEPPEVPEPGADDERASKPAETPAAVDEAPAAKPAPARKATRPRTRKTKE